jgi:hypothetical protein
MSRRKLLAEITAAPVQANGNMLNVCVVPMKPNQSFLQSLFGHCCPPQELH